ncbi:hypothetical protein N1851_014146 [Merluccius polli]|uniref:Uncharacterized protein n=1 Tax=Merluccius polli TaxID=89951 RepID=A0AA47P313_MERPO|nr:hypothetical protein N1851_014146 [Merluccius polli]
MVVQNLFEAIRKSFFIASPNSSHVRVFASVTATAALRLACRYLPAASGVPQAKKWVRELPPRQAPTTLRPQLRSAALTMEARNMAHSDSMYLASPSTWSKLSRRWETFPADPHNTFGSARSDRHPPPPS